MMHAHNDLRREPVVTRSFPQSSQRQYQQYHPATHNDPNVFDLPPALIHPGEDGYASLPQSPLDLAFGAGAGADPVDSICRSHVDLDYTAGACFDNTLANGASGLVGPGYGLGVNVNVNVPPYVSVALPPARSERAFG